MLPTLEAIQIEEARLAAATAANLVQAEGEGEMSFMLSVSICGLKDFLSICGTHRMHVITTFDRAFSDAASFRIADFPD